MSARQRMSVEERRADLLTVGARMFAAAGSYDELSMDDIATQAGVTRRLLYHYFATKAEFFGAIWQRAHQQVRATSGTDADTVHDGIHDMLRAYLDFYEANLPLVLIANRSSAAHDPAVRVPVERDLAALWNGFLDAAGATGHARELAEVAFTGWIAFVRASTLATLIDHKVSPAENLRLCMATLEASVGAHVDLSVAPRAPQPTHPAS